MYLKSISKYIASNNIKLFLTLNIIILTVLLVIGIVIYRQITVYVDNSDRSDLNEEVADIKGMYVEGGLDEILNDLSEDVDDVESYFLLLIKNEVPVYSYYPEDLGPFTNEQLHVTDSTAELNLVKTEISGDTLEYYITSLSSELVFIVGQSTEGRNEFYAFLKILFIGGFIFFLIILSVLSYLFIKRSLSPINELINRTKEIVEKGNYRDRISYLNKDYTYSQLVKNFNDLIAHIEYLINGITDTIDYFSHEVKTSLNRSILSIESAIKSNDKDLVKETLYSQLDETNKLNSFVNSILKFSSIQSGAAIVRKTQTDISSILNEIVSFFDYLAEEKGIDFEYKIDEEIYADVDRDKIFVALSNLVDNAIKYNKENGKININASIKNSIVNISIEDTGIGIEEENIEKIWEKHYRVRTDESGHGLGLSLVRAIIKLHNGRIDVESKYGEGTKFFIKFPARNLPENYITEM